MKGASATITVSRVPDIDGHPKGYQLAVGAESVQLIPGRSWSQLDHHKWVVRGLIEAPQSFHVENDGSVDINGERILLSDPRGEARLQAEINKKHDVQQRSLTSTTPAPHKPAPSAVSGRPDRVEFHVRQDPLGHALIQCLRGQERTETGLRGLAGLVQSGLMLKPRMLHVDPLQRAVEIDDVRYPCDAEGLARLEAALNEHYAPRLDGTGTGAIHVRENPASPTRFDVQFTTVRAGARFEVKGHLSEETLEVLQDPVKSGLLARGVVIKLAPPHLLFRRRTANGGEARIPEVPDLEYLHSNAIQLEAAFNHPALKNTVAPAAEEHRTQTLQPSSLRAIRVVRHPEARNLLWLEFDTHGEAIESRALTHHNVADLQHAHVFRDGIEVTLSFDNRVLHIFDDAAGGREASVTLAVDASDTVLAEASRLLTEVLRGRSQPA